MVALINFSNQNFVSYRIGFPREGLSWWLLAQLCESLPVCISPIISAGPWTLRLSTNDQRYVDRFATKEVVVPSVIVAETAQPRDGYVSMIAALENSGRKPDKRCRGVTGKLVVIMVFFFYPTGTHSARLWACPSTAVSSTLRFVVSKYFLY